MKMNEYNTQNVMRSKVNSLFITREVSDDKQADFSDDENTAQENPYSVCLKKTSCQEHVLLRVLRNKLLNTERKITQEKISLEELHEYGRLNKQYQTVLSLIKLSEYEKIDSIPYSNEALNRAVKQILSKPLTPEFVNKTQWSDYVKAAVSFIPPQSYGAKIESFYAAKKNYTKVNASLEKGGLYDKNNDEYIELKFSVLSFPKYQIDLVQIRPHHDLNKYHILTYNKDTSLTELYILTKKQMEIELQLTGNKLAHGTEKSKNTLNHPEYAIRFRYGSNTYKRWEAYKQNMNWG